ncbi:MAG: hypothetical protein JSU58_09855 [Dehalococcoidales bacterium]|nr:MAG: hypothetical protein JSU58_09855 [Dehalococcoidales bacterium]
MKKKRVINTTLTVLLLLVLVPGSIAIAHSPVFPGENHSPETAYRIDNPAKSWAIYDELDHADEGEYYQFDLSAGDKIQLALLTPDSPAESGFLPSFALLMPGIEQNDEVPDHIDVPGGYGAVMVEGIDPGEAAYEAFSPGWYYEVATLLVEGAPVDGTYYVVVFGDAHAQDDDDDPEHTAGAAKYGLVVGYLESFTPLELVLVPYSVQKVYHWEGQNPFVVLLPILLVLVIGGVIMSYRVRKGRAHLDLSKWLAYFAGLAFLGSGVSIVYQMVLTFTVTGVHGEALITLIFVVLSVILGAVTLLYAVREKSTLTPWRRTGLILTGLIALFVWSGLYLGPALVIAAALVPSQPVRVTEG